MVLTALVSGLPVSAETILTEALSKVFGEGIVDIIKLGKDNLRQRVRLSGRNTADVLVVLDQVSMDTCSDIENGLYNSDKFFCYKDDNSFVEFLNNKYELDLELPNSNLEVLVEQPTAVVDESLIERYESKLSDKDLVIRNLQHRVKELQNTIDLGGYDELPEPTSQENSSENLELRDKVATLESSLSKTQDKCSVLESSNSELKDRVSSLKEKKSELSGTLDSVNSQLTEYKVKYSNQTGLLRNKDIEISSLKKQLEGAVNTETALSVCQSEKEGLVKKVAELNSSILQLRVDIDSKDKDISDLTEKLSQLGKSNKEQEELERALQELKSERDDLFKQIVTKDEEYTSLQQEYDNLSSSLNSEKSNVSSLSSEIEELQAKVQEQDDLLLELNKQKIELSSQLDVLKKSTDRDSDIETLLADLAQVRSSYEKLSSSIFSKLACVALPQQSVRVPLLKNPKVYNKVMFAFAGSSESRKGAYRCLLNKLKNVKDRVVIVDVVSETSIDYVFEVSKVVSGMEWFYRGGGIQNYLSSTCLSNVKVLSPGLSYINDSYFLTVDWDRRLEELENSGYLVVVFGGDVSNLVGRVLHESFANCGRSNIYVHGNAIGSRTAVTNMRGIQNFNESRICYFDFNRKMQKFYDIVASYCDCEVVEDR